MRIILASALKLRPQDLPTYIPDIHRDTILKNEISNHGDPLFLFKSHTAHEVLKYDGKPFHTDKIVYIIRHPLDVFASYVNQISNNVSGSAKSSGLLFDVESAEAIKGTDYYDILFSVYCAYGTLAPRSKDFGSWFSNAEFFFNLATSAENRVRIIRYEDLMTDFQTEVSETLDWLGIRDVDIEEIESSASNATATNGKFYWKKKIGTYKEFLTEEQVDLFKRLHGERCAKLGYMLAED